MPVTKPVELHPVLLLLLTMYQWAVCWAQAGGIFEEAKCQHGRCETVAMTSGLQNHHGAPSPTPPNVVGATVCSCGLQVGTENGAEA